MMTGNKTQTGAENVCWDLSDLYQSLDDPQLKKDRQLSKKMADAFAQKYKDKVAALNANELAQALEEYEAISTLLTKLQSYAWLSWSTDTKNPDLGQLVANSEEHRINIEQIILFFELEWINAPDDVANRADDANLDRYRHFLKIKRLHQPYIRLEGEEKIMRQMSLSGAQSWRRYFDEVTSRFTIPFDGRELTLSEILSYLQRSDRSLRQQSAAALTNVLSQHNHALTFALNMSLLEKSSTDKIRGYESWISERNFHNQVEDAAADALVTAVTSRYDIAARIYRLLKQALGYEELYEYDYKAPIAQAEIRMTWDEARSLILEAFAAFDPHIADIARLFFDNNWIDAPPYPGKQSGAFCAPTSVTVHPYAFLNFTGNIDDVMTLAHELGHGIHMYLLSKQSELQATFHTPLTLHETASIFCEMLVFDHLINQQSDPQVQFAMRMKRLQSSIGSIFRQTAFNRFEHALHTTRREQGELSAEQITNFWLETQRTMCGDSVTVRDDYGLWWSYVPHFVSMPGYVYSYAFGELLVWGLYARYKQNPDGFADSFKTILQNSGSDWPHNLLVPLNINLQDPNCWHAGLDLLENFVAETEAFAEKLI